MSSAAACFPTLGKLPPNNGLAAGCEVFDAEVVAEAPPRNGPGRCEASGADVLATVEAGKEKAGFCSEPEVEVTEGVTPIAGFGPNPSPLDDVPSAALNGCSGGLPKLKPPDDWPKLKPDGFAAPSAGLKGTSPGLEPNRPPAEAPVLAPSPEVDGGGPAGVVELPKLKELVVAGVVEPNSGADVVAGEVDLSGVPNPPNAGLEPSVLPD